MGCHFLLRGIFLTQGSDPHLLHYRQILHYRATQEALGMWMMTHIWKTWLSIIFVSKYFPSKSVDVCSVFSEHLELEKTLTSVFLLVPCFFVWLLAIQLFLDVPGWACKGYFGLDIKSGRILRWPLVSLCLVVLLALWHVFMIGLFKTLYFDLHFWPLFLPSPSHAHPRTRDNYLMCWMSLFKNMSL